MTHVVVHSELYEPDEWRDVNGRLSAFADRLHFLHEESGGRVYALSQGR